MILYCTGISRFIWQDCGKSKRFKVKICQMYSCSFQLFIKNISLKMKNFRMQAQPEGMPGFVQFWRWTERKKARNFYHHVLRCLVTQSHPTLQPPGLQSARLLCPRNSPGKNTGVGCHFLPQEIFPTQESNLGSPAMQTDSLPTAGKDSCHTRMCGKIINVR